jgi:hypothetical protein
MIQTIFQTIGDVITEFTSVLNTLFEQVISLFYTAPSGEVPGQLTFIGVLALITVGVGLIWTVFGIVRRAIKMRG